MQARQDLSSRDLPTLSNFGSDGNRDFKGASLAATSSACEVWCFLGRETGAGGAETALRTAQARPRQEKVCAEHSTMREGKARVLGELTLPVDQ